jgi:hypothetical protein
MNRSLSILFAVTNAFVAALLAVGIFVALPDRWFWVDAPAALVVVVLLASSFGLVSRRSWSLDLVRAAALLVLLVGLGFLGGLTLALAFLSGLIGEVGRAGVVVFALVSALVLPYLVIYPSVLLVWSSRNLQASTGS